MGDLQLCESGIPGCFEVRVNPLGDQRGAFVKVFQTSTFAALGVDFEIRELFYSVSRCGVVRGLHFQLPPREMAKLVFGASGHALDFVVDLRVGSPTFGQHRCFELDADRRTAVFVPVGCAHGFAALGDECVVGYAVSREFDPAYDSGIHWDSAGIDWPVRAPIVSDRDAALVRLDAFESPFRFQSGD